MKRNFCDFLAEINSGLTINDLSEKLEELTKACDQVNGPGKMTISLKITPHGDGTASVAPEIKIVKPVKKRAASVFFVHKDGLYQENPNQIPLFDSEKVQSINVSKQVKVGEI